MLIRLGFEGGCEKVNSYIRGFKGEVFPLSDKGKLEYLRFPPSILVLKLPDTARLKLFYFLFLVLDVHEKA